MHYGLVLGSEPGDGKRTLLQVTYGLVIGSGPGDGQCTLCVVNLITPLSRDDSLLSNSVKL